MASRATIRDRVKYLPSTRISGIGETSGFDPATMKDQLIWSPRWPLLASAPATVVNGQRFRLAEAGREFGREYLGVDGAWVPQDGVELSVWQSNGYEWTPVGIWIVGYGSPSGFNAPSFEWCTVIDEAGTAWISNGTTWDLAQMPDVGEGYAVEVDRYGSVRTNKDYSIRVVEV